MQHELGTIATIWIRKQLQISIPTETPYSTVKAYLHSTHIDDELLHDGMDDDADEEVEEDDTQILNSISIKEHWWFILILNCDIVLEGDEFCGDGRRDLKKQKRQCSVSSTSVDQEIPDGCSGMLVAPIVLLHELTPYEAFPQNTSPAHQRSRHAGEWWSKASRHIQWLFLFRDPIDCGLYAIDLISVMLWG